MPALTAAFVQSQHPSTGVLQVRLVKTQAWRTPHHAVIQATPLSLTQHMQALSHVSTPVSADQASMASTAPAETVHQSPGYSGRQ